MRHEKDKLEQWQKKTRIKTCLKPGAENWINHNLQLVTLKSLVHVCTWPASIQLIILNNIISIYKLSRQNENSDLDFNLHLNIWFSLPIFAFLLFLVLPFIQFHYTCIVVLQSLLCVCVYTCICIYSCNSINVSKYI